MFTGESKAPRGALDILHQEQAVSITAEVYEVAPPHEWFWIVKLAAQNDPTRHEAVRQLPIFYVLTYADSTLKQSQPSE